MATHRALLNESQRAHLSVLAAGIEETLSDIERFVDPHLDADAVMTHHVSDLPSGFVERVRPILADLRGRVATFAERFSLDARSFSRSSSIGAHISAQIVRLDESGVTQLRGYGAVAHELDAILAPELEGFREQFAEIGGLLRRGGK
jgi:hypothetical protein